ncbi:MAG: NapC/NirT family cytochrome c [Verrucomicrobia bacterium]|jgi:nitrate/TMAO reductase-like tetraheme cytochrome c subunit|nr:NapC/NirT family cytochrome c [Verrucomicrobiota bacterium]
MKETSLIRRRFHRNWISLAGAIVALGSFFAFLLLFVIDIMQHQGNPYLGILAYVVAPMFLFLGVGLIVLGIYLERRQAIRSGQVSAHTAFTIDLSRPRDKRVLALFIWGTVIFLILTAIGSTQTYHYTESISFCGQACHEPMEPEFVAYQQSPHARVECVDCHVGSGAAYYVKAKLNGVHQLLAMVGNSYQRPIPTPIKGLRPAQDTCEQCHWPQRFSGNLDKSFHHFLSDEHNTPFSVRLLLNVGGGDHPNYPSGGIHWHVSESNRVEYIATDDKRQVIPWVRYTKPGGEVVEYRTKGFKGNPADYEVRTMDCMDCHNRPAHLFNSPNDEVDLALHTGRLDRSMPWLRSNAVWILTREYDTKDQARAAIAAQVNAVYPGHPQAPAAVAELQRIYGANFFPEMKADWRSYPDNRSHKEWTGCFRCHAGDHSTADGKDSISSGDCNGCHVILAQGAGEDLQRLNPAGHTFFHIDSDFEMFTCSECHNGQLQEGM